MYSYSVENSTISNIEELKIMDIVSSVPKNPDVVHQQS